MPSEIENFYGHRVRVRACGLCMVDHKLLLVNHRNLRSGDFWAPPGGGIELGEPSMSALEREFFEETNIKIKTDQLLFVTEYINPPIHAVELFFRVEYIGGELRTGSDPEMKQEAQIIVDSRLVSWSEIAKMDKNELHGIFKFVPEPAKILDLRGYFKL